MAAAAARLEAGSPLKLLARGWSVTWLDTDGVEAGTATSAALKSVVGVRPGAAIVTQLSDGKILSRVERTSPDAHQT
jgi:exonuclease VII large subunit